MAVCLNNNKKQRQMPTQEYLQAERAQLWREELRKTIKNKERTDLIRVKMPEVDAKIRSRTYDNVVLIALILPVSQVVRLK